MHNITTESTLDLMDKICEKYSLLLKKVISDQNDNKNKRKYVHNIQHNIKKNIKKNINNNENPLQIPPLKYQELDELNKSIIRLSDLKSYDVDNKICVDTKNNKSNDLLFGIYKNYKNDLILLNDSEIEEDNESILDIKNNITTTLSYDTQTSDDYLISDSNIDLEFELEKMI